MTRIYYVEDDPYVAQAVKEYLERYDYKVDIYTTAADAKEAVRAVCPQLVLLDRNMPGGQGDELCRYMRARLPQLPIIFLTVCGEARDIVAGFGDGADDYVVKPFEPEVLHSRIRALLRRAAQASGVTFCCDDIQLDAEKISVRRGDEEIALGAPEYRLLLLLMENKGKTVMRGQILEKLWDVDGNFVNDNTLTVTMKRLREKLHNPACIKTIRSFGYRMEDSL